MTKIPVVKTIAFAYSFVFTNIGTVAGVTVLPALLASAVDYLVRSYISAEDTTSAAGANLLISLAGMVTTILIWAVAAVGVTRAALGLPLGSGAFYFPISMLELRMFAAMLRFWLGVLVLLVLASFIAGAAFTIAGAPLDGAATPEFSPAILVASFVAWAAVGYAVLTIVRMGFLLSATVVSEKASGLQRSHDLARGNFWRLVAVLLAIAAPLFLLLSIAGSVLLGAALGADYPRVLEQEGMRGLMERAEMAIAQNLLLWEAFNTVIFILAAGLIYSAAAYAYRALTAGAPPAAGSLRPPVVGN